MQKVLLALLAVTAIVGAGYFMMENSKKLGATEVPTPVYDLWSHWKTKNGKTYGAGAEANYRFNVFTQNYNKIAAHQTNEARTYNMGFNKFMDLTGSEFATMFKGLMNVKKSQVAPLLTVADDDLPASVDWREHGAVNPIKDQGQCGSCWAFSTVGALEGASALFGEKKLQSFSEQQLVDCSSSFGNQGCNGGLMDQGFQYVEKYGITNEDAYKYVARDQKCKTNGGAFKISSHTDVPQGNANALAAAVVKQPVAIAVDANNFQFYDSGVFSDCSDQLDHGVTLVGYTSEAWIVKNSWGSSWGESGYIRVKRGNTCGIADAASYPNL